MAVLNKTTYLRAAGSGRVGLRSPA